MKNLLSDIMSTLFILLLLLILLLNPISSPKAAGEGSAAITITVTLVEAEIIEAVVEFSPQTIQQTQKRYINCYIELPHAYRVEDIEIGTIRLTQVNGISLDTPLEAMHPFKIGDHDKDDTPDLRIRFEIRNLVLNDGENNLLVTGNMTGGNIFKGTGALWLQL